jgi:hypothetical protein
MNMVRDVEFVRIEPVTSGQMTHFSWGVPQPWELLINTLPVIPVHAGIQ